VKSHPTLVAGLAAGVVCIGTAGIGCTVATYGVAAFGIGKSAVDNKIGRSGANWGRFLGDVAFTGAFIGIGGALSGFGPNGTTLESFSGLSARFGQFFVDPLVQGSGYAVARTIQIMGAAMATVYGAIVDTARS
jgi:hypothetical protein